MRFLGLGFRANGASCWEQVQTGTEDRKRLVWGDLSRFVCSDFVVNFFWIWGFWLWWLNF